MRRNATRVGETVVHVMHPSEYGYQLQGNVEMLKALKKWERERGFTIYNSAWSRNQALKAVLQRKIK